MKNPLNKLKSKKGVLLQNTLMLYILIFSNFFLSFIISTYESRVLGPVWFGVLSTANAIMVYFQLVIDFGFLLSGTQEVAQKRDNKDALGKIFGRILACKMLLVAVSVLSLLVMCRLIPSWRDKSGLYFLFFLATALTSLLPDYMYRGLERMSAITVRTVCIRVFFTAGVLLLLKKPDDIWMIPVFNGLGSLVAFVFSLVHLRKRFGIIPRRPALKEVLRALKDSCGFFFSRIATTAYSALNTLILDVISASGAVVGFYGAADKLITTGKNGLSPISDSLYPYMVKNRDFRLVRKVLLILEPLILLFCTACFVYAEPLCVLIFGQDYAPAASVLRAMLPVGVVILPSYILGFPTLTAMGVPKYANYSTIFGSVLHMVMLGVLLITDNLSMVNLAICVSITECAILSYRICAIAKNRHLLKQEKEG